MLVVSVKIHKYDEFYKFPNQYNMYEYHFFRFSVNFTAFFQINTVFNQFKIFPSNYFPLWTYGKLFPLSDIFINSSSYKQNNTENWKRMRESHAVQCAITTAKWIWCIKIVHSWNGWNTNRHGCICDDRIERN